jgi:hypothetical protein
MHVLWMRQTCGHCGSATPAWSDVCEHCGGLLHSPGRLRAAGVLYLVLGSLLAGGAGYLIVLIAGIVARSDDPEAATLFSGTWWLLALAFGALGFVLLVGVVGILMGVGQVRHGRRSLRLVRVVMVFYVIFWVGAMLIQLLSLLD